MVIRFAGKPYWIAWGPQRGPCMHRHPSRQDALRCAEGDDRSQRALRSVKSDRRPHRAVDRDVGEAWWPPEILDPLEE